MNLFMRRSLAGATGFFKEALFSEEIAKSPGLLQSTGPRLKLALLLVFLIATCLAWTIWQITILYIFSVILAVFSGIKIIFFIKRVWFFIPLFTLFIAIPAIFLQGLYTAGLFVLRVTTCVSFAVLVTITTKHNELIRSLRSMGMPGIFVSVLDMMYRYIFLFMKIFEEMHLSLHSRLIKKLDNKKARYWITSRIAFLFRRSLKMSEEVYMAMVARGYGTEGKRLGK